jgi:hypothetical protein
MSDSTGAGSSRGLGGSPSPLVRFPSPCVEAKLRTSRSSRGASRAPSWHAEPRATTSRGSSTALASTAHFAGRRLLPERDRRFAHDPLGAAEQRTDRGPQRRSQLRGVLDDARSCDRRVEARLDQRQRGVGDGRDRRRGAADGRLPRTRSPGRDDPRRVVSFGRHRGPRPGRRSRVRRPQARPHLRQPPELHAGDRGRGRQAVQPAAKPEPVLGLPRRGWREFRDRHTVHVQRPTP